jgi:2'-5' RNA ligase
MQNAETARSGMPVGTFQQSHRLFVAISLPEKVKASIERAQAELRYALPDPGVRWTRPGQFHLTLKFLGNVPVDGLERLALAVQRVCAGFPALRLRAQGVGAFPSVKSPRVIWAGVQDCEGILPKLQPAIDAAVREFTAETAEGQFMGHVTLGRARGLKRPQAETFASLAAAMAGRNFGEWTADRVDIIRSGLASDGARYTTLAGAALGPSHE